MDECCEYCLYRRLSTLRDDYYYCSRSGLTIYDLEDWCECFVDVDDY